MIDTMQLNNIKNTNPVLWKLFEQKLKIHQIIPSQIVNTEKDKTFMLVRETNPDTVDHMLLMIITKEITLSTRKLQTTISSSSKKYVQTNDDLVGEFNQALVSELVTELHDEMSDVVYRTSTPVNYRLDTERDTPERIVSKLQDASNQIGTLTKRGAGNKWILPYHLWCYISPVITPQLVHPEEKQGLTDLLFVGNWLGTDIYSSLRNTVVLVAYTGATPTDAGLFYCQHSLLAETTVDNNTQFLHKYGYVHHPDSKDYFIRLQVR